MRLFTVSLGLLILFFFSTGAHAKIVFASAPDGVAGVKGVYVMDDDGSNVTLLTETWTWGYPRWSPDGKQIVFTNKVDNQFGRVVLYLMNADGTNIRQLTHPGEERGWDTEPTFSPDGKSVLFKRYQRIDNRQTSSVCMIDIEKGKVKKLGDNFNRFEMDDNFNPFLNVVTPDWSPDGKHIIFSTPVALGGGGSGNIWIMDSKGRHAHELTDPVPIDGPLHIDQWLARWAPDGKKVLYAQDEFAWEARKDPNILSLIRKAHRYIICDQNGKIIRRLNIPKDFHALSIDWMDDDKSVVLSGYKYKLNEPPPAWGEEPASNIYKYEIRTGEMTRLIEHPGKDFMLVFSQQLFDSY